VLIVGKIRDNILRLFGHVMKKGEKKAVGVLMRINVKVRRRKGRTKRMVEYYVEDMVDRDK